jgi:hypothetical protein
MGALMFETGLERVLDVNKQRDFIPHFCRWTLNK